MQYVYSQGRLVFEEVASTAHIPDSGSMGGIAMMSLFYEHDVVRWIDEFEKIADRHHIMVTDSDIWDRVKHSETAPHLGNAYMTILLESIRRKLEALYPDLEVDYYINSLDTSLYINGEEIYSLQDYEAAIKDAEEAREAYLYDQPF